MRSTLDAGGAGPYKRAARARGHPLDNPHRESDHQAPAYPGLQTAWSRWWRRGRRPAGGDVQTAVPGVRGLAVAGQRLAEDVHPGARRDRRPRTTGSRRPWLAPSAVDQNRTAAGTLVLPPARLEMGGLLARSTSPTSAEQSRTLSVTSNIRSWSGSMSIGKVVTPVMMARGRLPRSINIRDPQNPYGQTEIPRIHSEVTLSGQLVNFRIP
jgi:hypothetical protein